jgi:uncharacterized protein
MIVARTIACVLLLGSLVFAQETFHRLPAEPVITVSGHGEVDVKPDQAIVRLGAIAQEKDAADAQADVNKIVQKAINRITGLGIKDEKIRTDQLSLRPVYGPDENRPTIPQPQQKIVAYEASNILKITLENLSLIGPVIDAGVSAGANDVQGVDFGLIDDTAATQQALAKATKQADAKAHAIADALNAHLGSVVKVDEGGVRQITPMGFNRGFAMAAAAAPTPIQAGQIKISAQVTVTYRIQSHAP